MSFWTCSKCTYLNPPSQKSRCEICLTTQPQSLLSSSSSATASASSESDHKWSCSTCTFLNPYRCNICEICGTRASASLLPTLEVDDDDFDEAQLGSSGTVFLPLRGCGNTGKGKSGNPAGGSNAGFSVALSGVFSNDRGDCGGIGNRKTQFVGNGGNGESDSGGRKGFTAVLRPCNKKRKDREDTDVGSDAGGSSGFRALMKPADKAIEVKSIGRFYVLIIIGTFVCDLLDIF